MMRTLKSGLTIGLMVAAMALSAGCGDNDNGHGAHGNDKNDNDTGSLTLIVGNASNLTFPITITCTFDATGTLAASDLTVTVREVTQNGAPGDATVLTVTPSVS